MMKKEQVLNELNSYAQLKQELQRKKTARDSYWFGMDGICSVDFTTMPYRGNVSDPTYQQMLKLPDIRKQIDLLSQEIEQLQMDLNKIDRAISRLSLTERIVMQAMYTEAPLPPHHRKTFRALSQETRYAEGTLKNARASALKKLAQML